MKRFVLVLTIALVVNLLVAAQQPLTIYVLDPEAGKAALWIAPSGQTVLIDSGSPGTRDVDRLMEVIGAAGVTRIDYLSRRSSSTSSAAYATWFRRQTGISMSRFRIPR